MAFNVFTKKGEVKLRSSVLKSDDDSLEVGNIERRKDDFTKEMESCIGNYSKATIQIWKLKIIIQDDSND